MQRKVYLAACGRMMEASSGERGQASDDFRSWAESQQMTVETIDILVENAVDSRAALAALNPEDLPHLGLKLGQLALLRRLIGPVQARQGSAGSAASAALSLARTLQVITTVNLVDTETNVYTVYLYDA